MATDDRIGYFSAKIFQVLLCDRLMFAGVELDIPSCSPDIQEEISDELVEDCYRAVYCRRQVYTPALRKDILPLYKDFSHNYSEFMDIFSFMCENAIQDLPIFEKFFTSLAIVTDMCDLCCFWSNNFHLQTSHLYWAMHADNLYKHAFYSAGGWTQIHVSALNYTSPYAYLTYIAGGREQLYYSNSAYACGVMMALKNFMDFMEEIPTPTKRTIAFDWVMFQSKSPQNDDQSYFDHLISSLDKNDVKVIEDCFFYPLKRLCNPCRKVPSVTPTETSESAILINSFDKCAESFSDFLNYMEHYVDSAQQSVNSNISSVLLSDEESTNGKSNNSEELNENKVNICIDGTVNCDVEISASKEICDHVNEGTFETDFSDLNINKQQLHSELSVTNDRQAEDTAKNSIEHSLSCLKNASVKLGHSVNIPIDKNSVLNSTVFYVNSNRTVKMTDSDIEENYQRKRMQGDPDCSTRPKISTTAIFENGEQLKEQQLSTLLSSLVKHKEKSESIRVMTKDSPVVGNKPFGKESKSFQSKRKNKARQGKGGKQFLSQYQPTKTYLDMSSFPSDMTREINKYTPFDKDENQTVNLASRKVNSVADVSSDDANKKEYSHIKQELQFIMNALGQQVPPIDRSKSTDCFEPVTFEKISVESDDDAPKPLCNKSAITNGLMRNSNAEDDTSIRLERKKTRWLNSKPIYQANGVGTKHCDSTWQEPKEVIQLAKNLTLEEVGQDDSKCNKKITENRKQNSSNVGVNTSIKFDPKSVEQPDLNQVNSRNNYSTYGDFDKGTPEHLVLHHFSNFLRCEESRRNGTKSKQRNKNTETNKTNDSMTIYVNTRRMELETENSLKEFAVVENDASKVKSSLDNEIKIKSKLEKVQQNGVGHSTSSDSNVKWFKDGMDMEIEPTRKSVAVIDELQSCVKFLERLDGPSKSVEIKNGKDKNTNESDSGIEAVETVVNHQETDLVFKNKDAENPDGEKCNDIDKDKESVKDILRMIFVLGDRMGMEYIHSTLHKHTTSKKNRKKAKKNGCISSSTIQKIKANGLNAGENSCQQKNEVLKTKL